MKKTAIVVAITAASASAVAFEPQAINTGVGIDFTPTITVSTSGDDNLDSTKDVADTAGTYTFTPAVKAKFETGVAAYNADLSLSFSDKVLTEETFLTSGKSSLGVSAEVAKDQNVSIKLTGEGEYQDDVFIIPGIDADYDLVFAAGENDIKFNLGLDANYKYLLNNRAVNEDNDQLVVVADGKVTAVAQGIGSVYGKSALKVENFTTEVNNDIYTATAFLGGEYSAIDNVKVNSEIGLRLIDPKSAQENVAGVEGSLKASWKALSYLTVEMGGLTDVELGEGEVSMVRNYKGNGKASYQANDQLKIDLSSEATLAAYSDVESYDHSINGRVGATYDALRWLQLSGFYQLDVNEPTNSDQRFFENEIGLTLKAGL